ncbi:MAG: discoidin domain-containing protein [Sedimentisphaerales bacterium]|nr:discoidin domain-containing protein [Sedimentisphaerales bacterium]
MGKRLPILVFVSFVAGLAFAPPVSAALVGWWMLDDGGGTVAVDSSGNGFNGSVEGGPSWIAGVFGGALELDGDNDTVRVPAMNLNTSAGATLTAWIRPAASQSDWCGVIFARGGGEAGIWITNANALRYSWSGAQAWNFDPGFIAPTDEWSFVALVVTPTSGTLYLNEQARSYQATHSNYAFGADTFLGYDSQNANKYYAGGLDDCRIYDHSLTEQEIQAVWHPAPPTQAAKPVPASGAVDVRRDVVLSWEPGPYAATHNIYFGTSFDDVNDATVNDPLGVLASQGQVAATYGPLSRLEFGQTYYWRVDEANAAPDTTVYKGNTWSFTVEPSTYIISEVAVTASTTSAVASLPVEAVNGSGLTNGQHSTEESDMWLGNAQAGDSVWIRFDFDRAYKLEEMLVWNYNGPYEAIIGLGVKDATIEYSADGETWTVLGDFELAQAPGTLDYAGESIDSGGVAVQAVRINIHSNRSITQPPQGKYGLSEVQFYYTPAHAREPVPVSGAGGVGLNPLLDWRAGREAAVHEVSLGTDPQAVAEGSALVDTTDVASYAAGPLALGTTYYWKVDEVNEAEAIATWPGDVWNFTTRQYIVVDDMESYSGDAGQEVFMTWTDGYEIATNGSQVGHNDPPYVETATVHSGAQAVPVTYNNSGTATASEAKRTFASPQDWTQGATTTLTLYFYGDPANNPAEPMWVRLTDQSGTSGTVTYGAGDAESTDNQALAAWHEWSIPLAQFGVNLTRVASMTLGFGGTGPRSSGMMLFDDIRLYPNRPATTATLAAYWALDGNATDGSGNGNDGTLMGGATWTAGGKVGGALSLNGTDAYANCGNGATLNITEAITLSAWVNPADANNGQHNPFVTKGDQAYAIKHNTSNQIETFIYDDNWYTATTDIDDSFDGEWHHVAATYDGLHLRLYVDGALRATTEHAGSIASATYNVNLGRNAQNTDRLYSGLIDEVRIYNGALSPAQVVQLGTP